MTPLFCWVFLLALVGRAASMPAPLVNDACALVCNPGAETEGERERRERDPIQYPRYPKGICKLQSSTDQDQARVLVSYCLKLCANELSDAAELNCFVLRSSFESHLGCYCPALVPLSPNTMRLHENWRITHLVNELSRDLVSTIFTSPIEQTVICELHREVFPDSTNTGGQIGTKCRAQATDTSGKHTKRDYSFMNRLKDSIRQQGRGDDIVNVHPNVLEKNMEDKLNEERNEEEAQQDEPVINLKSMKDANGYEIFCNQQCKTDNPHHDCRCEEFMDKQEKK